MFRSVAFDLTGEEAEDLPAPHNYNLPDSTTDEDCTDYDPVVEFSCDDSHTVVATRPNPKLRRTKGPYVSVSLASVDEIEPPPGLSQTANGALDKSMVELLSGLKPGHGLSLDTGYSSEDHDEINTYDFRFTKVGGSFDLPSQISPKPLRHRSRLANKQPPIRSLDDGIESDLCSSIRGVSLDDSSNWNSYQTEWSTYSDEDSALDFSSPEYVKTRDFAVRCGYKEERVKLALKRLATTSPSHDRLLEELVKIGPATSAISSPSENVRQNAARLPVNKQTSGIDKVESNDLRSIVIDGSNVAMAFGNKQTFSCSGIKKCVDWFRNRGHSDIKVYVPQFRQEGSRADAPITDSHLLDNLQAEDILIWTPSRRLGSRRIVCHDDRYILNRAVEKNAIIVSNDVFRDLVADKPEYKTAVEERLLMFTVVDGEFVPPDDPLGQYGPMLDQFLLVGGASTTVPKSKRLCPWGRRCTYGTKCRYIHTDGTRLSVSDRLAQEVKKERSRIRRNEALPQQQFISLQHSMEASPNRDRLHPPTNRRWISQGFSQEARLPVKQHSADCNNLSYTQEAWDQRRNLWRRAPGTRRATENDVPPGHNPFSYIRNTSYETQQPPEAYAHGASYNTAYEHNGISLAYVNSAPSLHSVSASPMTIQGNLSGKAPHRLAKSGRTTSTPKYSAPNLGTGRAMYATFNHSYSECIDDDRSAALSMSGYTTPKGSPGEIASYHHIPADSVIRDIANRSNSPQNQGHPPAAMPAPLSEYISEHLQLGTALPQIQYQGSSLEERTQSSTRLDANKDETEVQLGRSSSSSDPQLNSTRGHNPPQMTPLNSHVGYAVKQKQDTGTCSEKATLGTPSSTDDLRQVQQLPADGLGLFVSREGISSPDGNFYIPSTSVWGTAENSIQPFGNDVPISQTNGTGWFLNYL